MSANRFKNKGKRACSARGGSYACQHVASQRTSSSNVGRTASRVGFTSCDATADPRRCYSHGSRTNVYSAPSGFCCNRALA